MNRILSCLLFSLFPLVVEAQSFAPPKKDFTGMEMSVTVFGEKIGFLLPGKWRLLGEKNAEMIRVLEFVPFAETAGEWTRLVRLSGWRGSAGFYGNDPAVYLGDAVKEFVQRCGDESVVVNRGERKVGQRAAFSTVMSCPSKGYAGEHTVFMASGNVYSFSRIVKGTFSEQDLKKVDELDISDLRNPSAVAR